MKITENRVPLSTGSPVQDYSIVKALRHNDISITYRALSATSNRLVTLNEFFPTALASRRSSFSEISVSDVSKTDALQESIERFSEVIQQLTDCNHPALNRTLACLQHGGTFLSVHERIDSPTLQEQIQQEAFQPLPEADIRALLLPLLDGLQHLHSKGIVHLGIQPENILLREWSAPVLSHFCQSQLVGSSNTLAAMLALESVSPYLAPELLSKKTQLTAASDFYGLGMTLYRLMTGIELPYAQDRLNATLDHEPDPLPPLREQTKGYSQGLYNLVESCVRLRQKDRPQSVAEVLARLDDTSLQPVVADLKPAPQPKAPQEKPAVKQAPPRSEQTPGVSKPIQAVPVSSPEDDTKPAGFSRQLQLGAAGIGALLLMGVTYAISKPSASDRQLLTEHHSMERLAQIESQRLEATRSMYQLVTIPAGSFSMGCTQVNCPEAELPVRTIEVPEFQMMAHQVTFAMWDACVEQGGCKHRPRDEGWGRGNRPVINVSFNEITMEFIPWLNQAARQQFRLPSEVEWEYAAKAHNQDPYQFGQQITCEQARFGRRSGGECSTQLDGTTAVMSFAPNNFGLFDMHGNVWEWTMDCWNPNYQQAARSVAPVLSGNCVRRVQRGGTWLSSPTELTATYRTSHDATIRHRNNGFRLVQSTN
ncbi:SUMF1/EgtB/PvdO family nonheme iron enzyme [Alkalimonas sp. MEB108]|uniref:SUMF1/EgtB/PvdO family nonheme iron enzyme n=1 Tax=Alkalimonas cellulosilytica TaxID=3058395 RepID=A0ABU7J059_9GAMM|nr:SUMF1/EgtB/PvdO family nonheme iron enzyme [Alkalimonas sp. MEB108]MEE1999878.1 SUMF1/EgtB/PvdO family nonheme iron enzyme [Alkalimonas sp. MEB108]